jgi:caffeoyl-CoA O-methyltransferase
VAWIDAVSGPIHPALLAIEEAARPGRVPILDRDAGRVLGLLASNRRRIVEVGTAIGYSTLWMALASLPDAHIVTIDPDTSRTSTARHFWREAGVPDGRIEVVSAPALAALRDGVAALAGPFDMVFIDALKPEYRAYLDALIPRLEPGALVAADNVLWSGRVSGARPASDGDHSDVLRDFSTSVLSDPRFDGTILPVGDGLLVAVYRP